MKKWLLLIFVSAGAGANVLWSDYSLTYMKGSNYEVGDSHRQVGTFEYAAGLSWGGVFAFADRLHSENGSKETYAEFSPRAYLMQFKDSPVSAISASATIEMGDGFTHYLYGLGVVTTVGGFQYLNVDLLRRNNDSGKDNWQTTIAWGYPFKIGSTQWLYDGFIDWSSAISEQRQAAAFNFTSQLKWNISSYADLETSRLYVGMEYVYWNNKFGIPGVNERNANLLVKWHF